VKTGERTVLDVGDGKVEFAIKREPPQVQEYPEKRGHTFFDVKGFAGYLEKYGGVGLTGEAVVFADPLSLRADAALGEEPEKMQREVVSLALEHSPLWKPWLAKFGRQIPLGEMVEFLREQRRAILSPDRREFLFTLSQVRASTETTLHQGLVKKGVESVNGLVIKTKLTGSDSKGESVYLPDRLIVELPIFVGREPGKVTIDLVVGSNRGGTEIWAQLTQASGLHAEQQEFTEVVKELREEAPSCRVVLGQFKETKWKYE